MAVRTRFAPSPTGFLHIGGARTALFSWAYARRHGGKFVLRIEDTDVERSTAESVNAILEGLKWLGIDWDEGPFFQMKRLARYREVAEQLMKDGCAYKCWMTREELDALRKEQIQKGLKPRYDGRWRPERGLKPPADRPPVIRFRNPDAGEVTFNDLVKGPITVANAELDDLVILRADGVPTYNFGVVVDDLDMEITHVIRGDDHVNNTPRQVNIFNALKKPLPHFAHVPMILGADGERLSKRHGSVSVIQYRDEGFLPEALGNTLARLGWSHGNDEVISKEQLVQWFDLAHVSRSPAQFNPEKALWLNQQYMKVADDVRLSGLVELVLRDMGVPTDDGPPIDKVVALLKERANTVVHLAENARMFYSYASPTAQSIAEHVPVRTKPVLKSLAARLEGVAWERKALGATISEVLKSSGLKMPELAMPMRLIVTGRTQTPSLDVVLELIGRDKVLARMAQHLQGDAT
jgi:glutamyl-tRNA synthetase